MKVLIYHKDKKNLRTITEKYIPSSSGVPINTSFTENTVCLKI